MTHDRSMWLEDKNVPGVISDNMNNKSQVKVKTLFSLISTGTERLVCSGQVPNKLQAHMAVPYMQGSFGLPLKYGYSLVGTVTTQKAKQQLVHVLHPHQQTALVDEAALFTPSKELPARRMTLLSNMETIINAIWDSESLLTEHIRNNGNIAICGFGNIGALLAITLQEKGAKNLIIIEENKWRRNKAKSLGFECIKGSDTTDSFQLIYHTSSSQNGLQWCFEHASLEANIIELSWYGDVSISLKLGHSFHYRRVRLIASQVSSIPLNKPLESFKSRKELACEYLQSDLYDKLFADNIPIDQVPSFFASLRAGELPNGLIWCIEY